MTLTLDRQTLFGAAILLVGLALVYMPLLDQQMHGADERLITSLSENADIGPRAILTELGRTHGGAWTPLKYLDLRLDIRLFGTGSVTPFLLINLVLHALNAILLLVLLRRIAVGPRAAALITLTFALHPVQVESVAAVAGRGELLGALFVLLGLLLHVSQRPDSVREPGTFACLVLGVAASPVAVLLPAFMLLVDLGPRRITPRQDFWVTRLPLAVASILILVFLTTISKGYDRVFAASLPLADELHQLGAALLLSFVDLVGPYSLAAMHTTPPPLAAWIPAVVLPLLLATLIAGVRGRPAARAGAVCLLLILIAALLRGRLGTQYRADTWLYLAVIAMAWTVSARLPASNRVVRIAALAVLANWAVLAHEQVGYRHDDQTLVARTLAVEPTNWWARTMRADRLNAEGDPAGAETEALVALVTQPNAAGAVVALADSRAAREDVGAALRLYERSLLTHWGDRHGARDLGLVLLETDYPREATALLERADCAAGLALALARDGDTSRARQCRDEALTDPPDILAARLALAWLLATAPEPELRDPAGALELLNGMPGDQRPADRLDTEAAAKAGLGQFADAFGIAQEAARHAEESGYRELARSIRDRALVYLQSEIWTEARPSAPATNAEVEEQPDEQDDHGSDPGDR